MHPYESLGAFFLPINQKYVSMAQTFSDFVKSINSKKPHYFVIGHPISHSLSPLMHNTALQYHGIDASYYAIDVQPNELTSFIAWCNQDTFLGCNITLPFKQQLFHLVDRRSETADAIGAINTVSKKNGELIGDNTDVYGFLKPLESLSDVIEETEAVVFGTGGASMAVVYGLQSLGVHKIYLVTRDPASKRAQESFIEYIGYSQWPSVLENVSIVINTTPLGMDPNRDKSPVRDSESTLLEGKICYDLVYNPQETAFLKQAKDTAEISIPGLDMLIHQGSRAFEIWTGKKFPVKKVKTVLMNHFKN
jgi:shikimate dehydrogenase